MQTTYNQHPAIAVEGQPHGQNRRSVDLTIERLAQITTLTIADASPNAGEAWTATVTNDRTLQSYSVEFDSGASLALTLDAAVAALVANGKVNDLFTFTEDGATVLTATARHTTESYTWAVTPGGSATAAVAITQVSGGARVALGRAVAHGSDPGTMRTLTSTDTLADVAGFLFRTDANHWQLYDEADDAIAEVDRGRTMSIMKSGYMWVVAEDAMSRGGSVWVRKAQTASAGNVGGFRGSAIGATGQTLTATPSAINLGAYGFEFGFRGEDYLAYVAGDGSTTVAQACDGIVASLGSIAGLTITDNATDVTILTPVGETLDYFRENVQDGDVPASTVTLASADSDSDAIDLSTICRVERGAAAGGLALVEIFLR